MVEPLKKDDIISDVTDEGFEKAMRNRKFVEVSRIKEQIQSRILPIIKNIRDDAQKNLSEDLENGFWMVKMVEMQNLISDIEECFGVLFDNGNEGGEGISPRLEFGSPTQLGQAGLSPAVPTQSLAIDKSSSLRKQERGFNQDKPPQENKLVLPKEANSVGVSYSRPIHKKISFDDFQKQYPPYLRNIQSYVCSQCGEDSIFYGMSFCGGCGRKIKWEEK